MRGEGLLLSSNSERGPPGAQRLRAPELDERLSWLELGNEKPSFMTEDALDQELGNLNSYCNCTTN